MRGVERHGGQLVRLRVAMAGLGTRLVLLSGYPVKCLAAMGAVWATRIDLAQLSRLVNAACRVQSYIGHPATAKLLSELLGVEIPTNRTEWACSDKDVVVSVVLKKRCEKPDCSVGPADLEYYLVVPLSQCGARPTIAEQAVKEVLEIGIPCMKP